MNRKYSDVEHYSLSGIIGRVVALYDFFFAGIDSRQRLQPISTVHVALRGCGRVIMGDNGQSVGSTVSDEIVRSW